MQKSFNIDRRVAISRLFPVAAFLFQLQLLTEHFFNVQLFLLSFLAASLAGYILARTALRAVFKAALGLALPFLLYAAFNLFASDLLLLAFERFYFINLASMLWAALFASQAHSIKAVRFELMALPPLLYVFFQFRPPQSLFLYSRPIVLAIFLFAFSASFFIALGYTWFAQRQGQRRELVLFVLFSILLPLIIAVFAIRPMEDRASKSGGGLIQPNFFQFDFSAFLRLESEISLNDDLVLIVHKGDDESHKLLRRFILSGYSPKAGFYVDSHFDLAEQPAQLPNRPTSIEQPTYLMQKEIEQEVFMVNFDPKALVAINRPSEIVPYKTWNASSFSAAYRVISLASEALSFELFDTPYSIRELEHSEQYLEYGQDREIEALAKEISQSAENTWDAIRLVYEYLKYGEYSYSLKPGIAKDGRQLHHFLFNSKKGYCTYYAFAMCLMLRSLGIPSRVAVGFVIDPKSNTLSYYPVRADMAHAWVEVWFPSYGWIEYDPTSQTLAANEEFNFSSGVDPRLLSQLMEEILSNRENLEARWDEEELVAQDFFHKLAHQARLLIVNYAALLIGLLYALLVLLLRTHFFLRAKLASWLRPSRKRAKAVANLLFSHALRRLRWAGYRLGHKESLFSFAKGLPQELSAAFFQLLQVREEILFAKALKPSNTDVFKAYRALSAALASVHSRAQRLLPWLLPAPLLGRWRKGRGRLLVLVLLSAFISSGELSADSLAGSENDIIPNSVDEILAEAKKSVDSAYWDRALQLLEMGKKRYPHEARFPIQLGNIYHDKELYRLAWKEYLAAERLEPENKALLYRLANTAGNINLEHDTVSYLEKLVALEPDNNDYVGDLAWAYYKIHRSASAIALIEEYIKDYGDSSWFNMTLGTLYGDLKKFDEAKQYYQASIEESIRMGSLLVQSVGHYNYSILLNRFLHHEEAYEQTVQSIEAFDRPSGHLAKGEMHMMNLDFTQALNELYLGYESDSSPLSKISLATAYLKMGDLEQALNWLLPVFSNENMAWMYNYGIDLHQHLRNLHYTAYEIYSGMARRSRFSPPLHIFSALKNIYSWFTYIVKAEYHLLLSNQSALKSATAWQKEGMEIEAAKDYYGALERHPRRAKKYLQRAAELELQSIPQKEFIYKSELARLAKNEKELLKLLPFLDQVWQRDSLQESWVFLAKRKSSAASYLYSLNPGALLQQGIRLPVNIDIILEAGSAAHIRKTRRLIGHIGFRIEPGARHELKLSLGSTSIAYQLLDTNTGSQVKQGLVSLSRFSRRQLLPALLDLQTDIFTSIQSP